MMKRSLNYHHFFLIVILIYNNIGSSTSETGYLKIEGSEQQHVHLEDFFWTGSGDGPPPIYNKRPIDPAIFDPGKETIFKTSTVLATVYIDDPEDSKIDTLCVYDCNDVDNGNGNGNDNGNHNKGYSTSDRRFWLLTIIAGFFTTDDFTMLEDKLASLYRIAFVRQQARHLGIANKTTYTSVNSRRKRQINILNIKPTRTFKSWMSRQQQQQHEQNTKSPTFGFFNFYPKIKMKKNRKLIKRNVENYKSQIESNNDKLKNINKVNVVIHNITLLTENQLKNTDDNQISTDDNNDNIIANQTEIIYTVFVGGKPVLATTAADDMRLITHDEVVQVMNNMVFTKAEPYLKEPQATPLIPAISNGNSYWIGIVSQNPLVFVLSCVGIFLLIICLCGILILASSRIKRNSNARRQTANEQLMSHQIAEVVDDNISIEHREQREEHGDEQTTGMTNMAFESEQPVGLTDGNKRRLKPISHNVHPPLPARPISSTSTSDSSNYYNDSINSDNKDGRHDKTSNYNFFKKHKENVLIGRKTTQHQNDDLYAMVKEKDKKSRNKQKQKIHRRKYMTENKVGFIEKQRNQMNNSELNSGDSDLFEVSDQNTYFEHNEAFNPNVMSSKYNNNKLLHDSTFIVGSRNNNKNSSNRKDILERIDVDSGADNIQKDYRKPYRKHEISSDTQSIGSFLSMVSVKSFPRCTVPEPLSRVLEPVSVTHLDHFDDVSRPKQRIDNLKGNELQLIRSQSDGADPGVIGPVVWELHKQAMENSSPLRDPVSTRCRFEGLLEGAIKLYGNDKNHTSNEHLNDDKNERSTSHQHHGGGGGYGYDFTKESRGKSAATIKNAGGFTRSDSGKIRPYTAGDAILQCINATQPPSPSRAWGSGAPSPLVRPMSAGPFHRPEAPTVDVSRVLAPQTNVDPKTLSTAPLIEAIHCELKKFNSKKI